MRRCLVALLLAVAVVIGVIGDVARADRIPRVPKKPVGDQPVMTIKGWGRVVDPEHDCRVAVEGRTVSVTVPGTSHEFAAELKRWNAPRILRAVHGDFIAEIKVCGNIEPPPGSGTTQGRKPYHGGGLLLIADRMNHMSVHRGAFREGDHVQNYLNFELRRDGKVAVSRYEIGIPPDGDCYVRLERRGNEFVAMFSPDHVKWQAYDPIEADFPANGHIGAAVVNSTKEPFTCAFEDFTLFERKEAEDAKQASAAGDSVGPDRDGD